MEMELDQVRLALNTEPEVMKILKRRGQFRKDEVSEYVPVVFNSAELRFRPKGNVIVGRTIARALMNSSQIIVGDDINGELTPYLTVLEEISLSAQLDERNKPTYQCEFCRIAPFISTRELARHVISEHSDELGSGEPAAPEPSAKPAVKAKSGV